MQRSVRFLSFVTSLALLLGLLGVASPAHAETQTLAADTFGRTIASGWGSAEKGGSYKLAMSAGVSASVTNGVGQVTGLGAGKSFSARLPLSTADVRMSSSLVTPGSGVGVFHSLRLRESADGGSGYSVTFRETVDRDYSLLSVSYISGSGTTWIDGVRVPALLKPNQKVWLEARVTGTNPVKIAARAWTDGAKPTEWQVVHEDSSSKRVTGSGAVSINDYVSNGSNITMRHDDMIVETATDDDGGAPTPEPPIAQDAFDRAVAAGWGGSYKLAMSAGVSASVTNGVGQVTGLGAGKSFSARLPLSTADVRMSSSLVTPGSGVGVFHSLRLRESADGGSGYSVTFRETVDRDYSLLSVSYISGSGTTWIDGVRVPALLKPNQKVWLEARVTGTNPVKIAARAWTDGAKPTEWQVVHEDSSSKRVTGSGAVSINDYVSNGSNITMRHDDVLVQKADTSATAPAPAPAPAPPADPDPVPAPPVNPQPAAAGARGTVVGSQSFPVPANAIHVDSAKGSDSAAGTKSAPVRTVAKAVALAPTGGTVVMRAGSYHEQVEINKRITLQNYPGEAAWFDGSRRLTNWTKSGSTWVSTGWNHKFPKMLGGNTAWRDRFIDKAVPQAAYSDQVFVNGTQLKQVLSAGAVVAGTFHYDEGGQRLIIGTDPTGKEVRASALTQAIKVIAADTVVQGIGVRRYATPYEKRGAVLMDAKGGTFRHVAIVDNATTGLVLSSERKRIENVLLERNGQLGMNLDKSPGAVVTKTVAVNNNSERFKPAPVAGGIKLTRIKGLTVRDNEVRGNRGIGIWLDENNSDFKIVNNLAIDNTSDGIQVEISQGGIVANNTATGVHTGIRIFDSGDVKVFNNVLRGGSHFGIWIQQDERWKTRPSAGFPLLSKNIYIANNVFACSGLYGIFAKDGVTNIPADKMGLTINGNLFFKRVAASDPKLVGWGQNDNIRVTSYSTPAELAAARNSSWRNASGKTCFTSVPAADLSAAQSVAVALPADVAAAIGVPTGTKKVGLIG